MNAVNVDSVLISQAPFLSRARGSNDEDETQSSSLDCHHSLPSEAPRPLSRRICDMINEAFPTSMVSDDMCDHTPSGENPQTPSNSCVELCLPPAYSPPEQLPRYVDGGSLAERLACPDMREAFAVSVTYSRVPMIAPLPNYPCGSAIAGFKLWAIVESANVERQFSDSTYYELMLLAPGMSFVRFLREVEGKCTAYILSERPSKRLMAKEKVVFKPVLKLKIGRGSFLKRTDVVKSAINAQNWSAAVAMLQNRSGEAQLKVKFWTERPGSAEEALRKERIGLGYMDVESMTVDAVAGLSDSRAGATGGEVARYVLRL